MLALFRRLIRGPGAYALLAVIILPLSFFGFNWMQVGGGPEVEEIGVINGEEITLLDIQRRSPAEIEALEAQGISRDRIDPERLQLYVFQRLALEKLFDQEARRRDLTVSQEEADRYIVASPQFHDQEGNFSPGIFRQLLNQMNYTPGDYRDVVRTTLTRSKLVNSYRTFGFLTPPERKRLAGVYAQRRSAVYAVIDAERMREGVELKEEETAERYEKDQSKYNSEEAVVMDYLLLERKYFYEEVPEDIVRSYYEDELNQQRARKHISHILLEVGDDRGDEEARSELAALRDRVLAGEDFADLARQYSEDIGSAPNGGDLGWLEIDVFPEDFAAHVAPMEPGDFSQPVRTDSGGWHLIHYHDDFDYPSYEERREELYEAAQRLQSEENYRRAIQEASVNAFAANDLDPVAQLIGREIQTSGKFSRKSPGEWPFDSPAMVERAFSETVLQGGNSEMIKLDPDTYALLHLNEYFPVRALTYEEAKPKIEGILRAEKSRAKAKTMAADYAREIREGVSAPQDYWRAKGFEPIVVESVRRTDAEPESAVLDVIFSLPYGRAAKKWKGTSTSFVKLDADKFAVVSLSGVDAAAAEEEERRSWAREIGLATGEAYSAFLDMKLRRNATLRYFPHEDSPQ